MYSSRYQGLDKPNFISTYSTGEIRVGKLFENKWRWRIYEWGWILLLQKTRRGEKNLKQSWDYVNWSVPQFRGTSWFLNDTLLIFYLKSCFDLKVNEELKEIKAKNKEHYVFSKRIKLTFGFNNQSKFLEFI